MIRVLVLIAITGFFVGLVALGGAFAIGGPDLATYNWGRFSNWSDHHERKWEAGRDDWEDRSTRELAWTGGDRLDLDVPADVTFTQAEGPGKVVITGPADIVGKITLENGRLSLEDASFRRRKLDIVITAPGVTSFSAGGASELTVNGYQQDTLTIDASGASDVKVNGQARLVRVDASGSADVDLGGVVTTDAEVEASGSADVTTGPTGAAQIEISGGSEVTLTTKPARLATDISGGGELRGGQDE